jgi:hypothetical protein
MAVESQGSRPVPYGRHHPEQITLYQVVQQHRETSLAPVGADGWDRHGVPPTANPQLLRYAGCGILDYGRARSQWLDSAHSSDVRSWPILLKSS